MRMQRLVAVLGAVLLLLAVAGSATAAAKTSFTGLWISTDTDLSTQVLRVGTGTSPSVSYQDFYASVCFNAGSPTTHFNSSGTGTVTGDTLDVHVSMSGCGPYDNGAYDVTYYYDSGTDTLSDDFGITWYRVV
jgi:hypothetical protein